MLGGIAIIKVKAEKAKVIAWAITGAGHYLKESFEVFKEIKANKNVKITIYLSRAGEEVVKMYGLYGELQKIAPGGYLEEVFLESSASSPKAGRLGLGKYGALIVAPATSNTTAKIAHGIADTLVTNAVAQAIKGGTRVYILPVDVAGEIKSQMPYFIDRELCKKCKTCKPRELCPSGAIGDQIDLLRCTGCGECIKLCRFGAIRGGIVEIKVRDIDRENVNKLKKLEGIKVLRNPREILRAVDYEAIAPRRSTRRVKGE
ncbi:MAG: dihydromethanopterin reductase (acceptor) [Halobacteria archaeon]